MRHPLPRPSRPVLTDAALWAGLTAVTGYGFLETDSASLVPDLLLPSAVLAVAVPLSRRRPGAAVLLAGGLCALGLADPVTPAGPQVLSLAVLSFLLGARVAAARGPLLVLAACLALAVAVCAVLRVQPVWWFYALTVLPAALLPPWLAGRHWRGRRELVREGWRLAVGLEERQHLVAERARLTERTDIAADMHDSLGHVLSLVALRAGALELSPDLTARDRADLAELRGTVADAVEQLRETVAVLHEPRASPGGDDTSVPETVEELLGRAVASGVPVRWERRGPVPALSPLVERGIHRVVREALTNAVKHAPGAPVRVEIVHEADRTRVGVVNGAPPPGAAAGAGPEGGRRGLTGLRERVSVLGGSLRTEPYRGGFRVGAVLPHRPPGRRAPAALPDPGAAPESARRLAEARRTARRRSALALVAPLAAAAFFVPAAGYLARQLTTGVLPPHRYDRLEPGRTRAELAPLLPARPFPYPPDHVRAAPAPAGARCEAYRSGPDLLHQVDFYRLCWSGGVLVSRDTIRADPR
ncbi:sensor histidine kinase [Streptomyces termitum]|uniref:histidine kinase n=1 Tax=Streptomyces termitum TaxID=67368 RepID=A0A918T5V4_9ACTN|nr:histidine kinase [Streptomyces termitum]GHA92031.1 histidine kinase [Streptomyces termitum]